MNDQECVSFLQWALPHLRMRWAGFRRVRRQVCRRIDRRLRQLDLVNANEYRNHLDRRDRSDDEWRILDSLCRITISRFYRDRGMFDQLAEAVLPALAERASARQQGDLRCWCAGCASGEEVYTLKLIWDLRQKPRHRRLDLRVLGTDTDSFLLKRARAGLFPSSSLRELPTTWLALAFDRQDTQYRLRDRFRDGVEFHQGDVRREAPDQSFDLVLCRNLALTYFEETQQREVLARIGRHLHGGGALFVGVHEELPEGAAGFSPWPGCRAIFRREG